MHAAGVGSHRRPVERLRGVGIGIAELFVSPPFDEKQALANPTGNIAIVDASATAPGWRPDKWRE